LTKAELASLALQLTAIDPTKPMIIPKARESKYSRETCSNEGEKARRIRAALRLKLRKGKELK
jgi:hypothetical protein